jgi:hypothetical protein
MKKVVRFVNYLTKIEYNIATSDGKTVDVFEFNYQPEEKVLKAWAKHFRNHYCLDSQIDILREGTGLSRKDFLIQRKFPDEHTKLGSGIRSGDFAEILIADYFEFILDFWVPRTRYIDKTVRDESKKGTDIIGFKYVTEDDSPSDILIAIESKAKFSKGKCTDKLQEAIDHSSKDQFRLADSLNGIKQRLLDEGRLDKVQKISRFQNQTDNPYIYQSGAVAFVLKDSFSNEIVTSSTTKNHANNANVIMFVIKGEKMKELVNKLYEYAADEA